MLVDDEAVLVQRNVRYLLAKSPVGPHLRPALIKPLSTPPPVVGAFGATRPPFFPQALGSPQILEVTKVLALVNRASNQMPVVLFKFLDDSGLPVFVFVLQKDVEDFPDCHHNG